MSSDPRRDCLAEALQRTDPAALLVPPRILRRVIKLHRGLGGLGLQVPHHKCYLVARDELLAHADRAELGVSAERDLPETLILLAEPEPEQTSSLTEPQLLLSYWRLLFHAHVHLALDRLFTDGKRTDTDVASRVVALGTTEFDEARAVLRQENLLLPPRDDRSTYIEFAALYLELRSFDNRLVPRFFPGVVDPEAVDRLLAEDVDRKMLFIRTRLEGACDPGEGPLLQEVTPTSVRPDGSRVAEDPIGAARLLEQAGRDRARGNGVRAAIRCQRAAFLLRAGERAQVQAAGCRDLDRLTERLRKALALPTGEVADWRAALDALLPGAAEGVWSAEARLLYDLQKACADHEREIYAVDAVEWAVTFGRRPLRRHLPHQKLVLAVKHLRGAAHRLPAVRLPHGLRGRFVTHLLAAVGRGEERLRDQFRPSARAALTEVGLVPHSFAERVARDKLVEELLDGVAERGHLSMSDLRDGIARNRLKLPDLGGPDPAPSGDLLQRSSQFLGGVARGGREFFAGDRLIRANRRLAYHLDGVYRRGEIYLRWLQRFSAALFGTRPGRFLTRYLLIPFGGSFVLLEGVQFLADELTGGGPHNHVFRLHRAYSVPALGFFLLALIHLPAFRRLVTGGLSAAWRGFQIASFGLPRWVVRLPVVRRIVQSRQFQRLYQLVFKPSLYAGLTAAVLHGGGVGAVPAALAAVAVFLLTGLFLNSRTGQRLEEMTADHLARTWQLVRHDILPGLVNFILYLFRRMLDEVERVLYTVDEWLRFRTSEGRFGNAAKTLLGVFWFFATYLIRVVINLFVEPTINPIKHFPVVTVAAKFLLPVVPELLRTITAAIDPVLGVAVGGVLATVFVFWIPGFAGFLVWEFKENWKLYEANQPPVLSPEVIGSHGETLARLLRPGFHSGTVPKLFARLRHAEGRSVGKQHEALHHVRESVRHFVERGLFPYLAGSPRWGCDRRLKVGEVRLATNRIRVELSCRDLVAEPLCLDFDEQAGRLVAGVSQNGWLDGLSADQRHSLSDALTGFYHLAGVELVREQLRGVLPAGADFHVREAGIVVWLSPDFHREAVYDLAADVEARPMAVRGEFDDLPPLPIALVRFANNPIRWEEWVRAWERDRAGEPQGLLKMERPLLPGEHASA